MPELSRRRFLTGTSLGVAGIAASTAIPAMPPLVATGATRSSAAASAEDDLDLSAVGGDIVAHVRDASTGEVAILVGGTERIHHDPKLVARLLRVARQAQAEA
jgi:hypothetical protein